VGVLLKQTGGGRAEEESRKVLKREVLPEGIYYRIVRR